MAAGWPYRQHQQLSEIGLKYYKVHIYNLQLGRFVQTYPTGDGDGMNWMH